MIALGGTTEGMPCYKAIWTFAGQLKSHPITHARMSDAAPPSVRKQKALPQREGLLLCDYSTLVHRYREGGGDGRSHGGISGGCDREGVGTGCGSGVAIATAAASVGGGASASRHRPQCGHQHQDSQHRAPATPPGRNSQEHEEGQHCAAPCSHPAVAMNLGIN